MGYSRGSGYTSSGQKFSYDDYRPMAQNDPRDPYSFAAMQNYGSYGTTNMQEIEDIRRQQAMADQQRAASQQAQFDQDMEVNKQMRMRRLGLGTMEEQLANPNSDLTHYDAPIEGPMTAEQAQPIEIGMGGQTTQHTPRLTERQLRPEIGRLKTLGLLGRTTGSIGIDEYRERERIRSEYGTERDNNRYAHQNTNSVLQQARNGLIRAYEAQVANGMDPDSATKEFLAAMNSLMATANQQPASGAVQPGGATAAQPAPQQPAAGPALKQGEKVLAEDETGYEVMGADGKPYFLPKQ